MKLEPEFKFLIPIITKGLKKEYFTEKAGFVGAYTMLKGEVERGLYSNNLYLLFDYDLNTKEKRDRFFTIDAIERSNGRTKYKTLYEDPKHIVVDGKDYLAYGYPITGNAIFIARDGCSYSSSFIKAEWRNILRFWGIDDDDVWNLITHTENYCGMKYPFKPLQNTKYPTSQMTELNKLFKQ